MWAYGGESFAAPRFQRVGLFALTLTLHTASRYCSAGATIPSRMSNLLSNEFLVNKKSCASTGFYSRLSDLNQVFWSQLPVASRQTPPTFAAGGLHAAFSSADAATPLRLLFHKFSRI